MRTYVLLVTGAALLAAFSLMSGDAARADDGAKQSVKGVWVTDIRVVRVDPATAAGAEAPSPFPELTGTTISLPWPEILARLKKRGTTTILLDQRATALTGHKCVLAEEYTTPLMAPISEDINNRQLRSMPIRTGCTYEQTVSDATFDYQARVRGALTAPAPKKPPVQYTVTWGGSHPCLHGQTLVLRHRRQIAQAAPAEARAIEHYAFITGRFVPAK